MEQTSRTSEEKLEQEVSTVVAVVSSRIPLPSFMTAGFERNRSDTSLRLTFQQGFFYPPRALTILPFLGTEITELILATTSKQMSAFLAFPGIGIHSRHMVTAEATFNKHQTG